MSELKPIHNPYLDVPLDTTHRAVYELVETVNALVEALPNLKGLELAEPHAAQGNDELEQLNDILRRTVQQARLNAHREEDLFTAPVARREIQALIQQERQKGAREALEGVRQKTVMNPEWPIKYASLRSELSEAIDEALKELDVAPAA